MGQIKEMEQVLRTTDTSKGERQLREDIIVFKREAAIRLFGATSQFGTPGNVIDWGGWFL